MRVVPLLCGLALAGCIGSRPLDRTRPDRVRLPAAERINLVRDLVRDAAKRHQVPEDLVLAVIHVESGFRPDVCSRAGACGLMQLMPRTAASLARRLGHEDYDVEDPAFNIDAGTAYLAYLLKLFKGDKAMALAGYNAGPARARRWIKRKGRISRPVRRYVANVLAAQKRFSSNKPSSAPHDEGLDQDGLRALLRAKESEYGPRPDEPLPGPG